MEYIPDISSCSEEQPKLKDLLSVNEAAERLPIKKSPNAVRRWMREGCVSRSGVKVRLKHLRLGDKLFTTEQRLLDFFQGLADSDVKYFDAERQEFSVALTKSQKSNSHLKRLSLAKEFLKNEGLDPIRSMD